MNSLSWLIYLADVADNLDWFFWLIMFFGIGGTILWIVIGLNSSDDFQDAEWKAWRRIGIYALLPCFILGVIFGSIVPSKNTVYAIAASEMGEKALSTPTAGKAVKALDAWLDRQISGEPEKEDTNSNKQ